MKIAPEIVSRMSREEKCELLLMLETLALPKMARFSESPSKIGEKQTYGDLLEMFRRERAAKSEEQLAQEEAARNREEDELLAWREGAGKDYVFKSELQQRIVDAHCRMARHRREAKHDEPVHQVVFCSSGAEQAAPEPQQEERSEKPKEQTSQAEPPVVETPRVVTAGAEPSNVVTFHRVPRRPAVEPSESATVNVSVYDDPMTMEAILKREKAYRENHVLGGGWGT